MPPKSSASHVGKKGPGSHDRQPGDGLPLPAKMKKHGKGQHNWGSAGDELMDMEDYDEPYEAVELPRTVTVAAEPPDTKEGPIQENERHIHDELPAHIAVRDVNTSI
eukprot:CAMPEP_0184654704 /NCGR_PEP_ID=MMETSP0308-20130426/12362_1 /TAXON_ID=38269 /ORGANISM="Gloeochaete witrockiana, Strain SAG 46.84" /LENGTH=106 /DNA_ID=CAMNT_0027090809 /DNA_START=168 /DNA_END=488 /DNA_ORIENTATION=+